MRRSPEEIATFCDAQYGVTFSLTEKVEVNGPSRHPLYQALVDTADEDGYTGDIRWNFEKFLITPDGAVTARYGPRVEPEHAALVAEIERLTA